METDGWQYHRIRAAFERDRRRDATLVRAGYRTLRFRRRHLEQDPAAVPETLAIALSARPSDVDATPPLLF